MVNMLLIVIEQSLLHLPLMIGSYVSLSLLKVPDLGIEAAYVVGAIAGSYCVIDSSSLSIVLAASLIGGALVGILASLLTRMGRLSHLLSSIITIGLFHGINQFISSTYLSLSAFRNPLMLCGGTVYHPELYALLLIGCLAGGGVYLLLKTQLGYSYAVYGNNPDFFRHYGISTSFVFITGITIAHALAGMSGYMVAQSNNFIELNMGMGKVLFCITALIIGKSIVGTEKPYSLMVPVVGTIAYFMLQQVLLKIGFNVKYFTAVQAFILMSLVIYSNRANGAQSGRSRADTLGI